MIISGLEFTAGHVWHLLVDTREESGFLNEPSSHAAGEEIELLDRSLCLLRLEKRDEPAKPSKARRRAPLDRWHQVRDGIYRDVL